VGGDAGSQVGNVADRIALEPREFPARVSAMLGGHLPALLGAAPTEVTGMRTGHAWLFWPIAVGLATVCARAGWLQWQQRRSTAAAAGWYFTGVGLLAVAAYIATRPADGVVVRYLLLAIFVPIGLVAAHLTLERRRAWLALPIGLAALCAATAAVDHVRLLSHFVEGREPNEARRLADALEAEGVRVAESGYWRAYKISFLTRERVKVASTDVVRITEYQRLAREAGASLVSITETPCPGGTRVDAWYLCRQP
jgi:hypothetical protein